MLATALYAAIDAAPSSIKYCVTCDGPLRKAQGVKSQRDDAVPHEFVGMVKRSREALALTGCAPSPDRAPPPTPGCGREPCPAGPPGPATRPR